MLLDFVVFQLASTGCICIIYYAYAYACMHACRDVVMFFTESWCPTARSSLHCLDLAVAPFGRGGAMGGQTIPTGPPLGWGRSGGGVRQATQTNPMVWFRAKNRVEQDEASTHHRAMPGGVESMEA